MADAQITLITLIAIVFLMALFAATIFISLLRRLRNLSQRHINFWEQETQPILVLTNLIPPPMPPLAPVMRAEPKPTPPRPPIPDHLRIPTISATSEQAVLTINPVDGPSRDQRNVRKLIEFLKQQTVAAEPIQKST